jgi:hypothetical protein
MCYFDSRKILSAGQIFVYEYIFVFDTDIFSCLIFSLIRFKTPAKYINAIQKSKNHFLYLSQSQISHLHHNDFFIFEQRLQ